MSNNSWIKPVSIISACILISSIIYYNINNSAKETPSNRDGNSHDPYNEEVFGGRRSKRRKYRKNASKKKR